MKSNNWTQKDVQNDGKNIYAYFPSSASVYYIVIVGGAIFKKIRFEEAQ